MKKTDTNAPKYWQSLEERNGGLLVEQPSDEFAQPLEIDDMDPPTRRHFMGVMGASMAMASMSGCIRRPVEKIVSYREMPEDILPGAPNYYATGTHIGGEAIGLVVESNEGRPTKVEGNFEHPWSNGGTNAMHQASVIDLYDPLRVQAPHKGLKAVEAKVAYKGIKDHFASKLPTNGKGVYVLSGANPSPTFDTLMRRFRQRFPLAQWLTYEPVSHDNERNGLKAAFGKPRRAVVSYERARVVLSLDADFLGTGAGSVVNSSRWAKLRTLKDEKSQMSRLYSVEGVLSLTGANADHRLRLATSQIEAFAFQVAIELQKDNLVLPADLHAAAPEKAKGLSAEAKEFAKVVASDLTDATKPVGMATHGVVVAGRRQSALVHNLVAAINQFLVKTSGVVTYFADPGRPENDAGDAANIAKLKADLDAGKVDTLVVIGSNPVYSAPGNLGLKDSIRKAKTLMSLADYHDETAKGGTWTFPRAHYLEAWGDLVSPMGTLTIQQPLIAPLHEGTMSDIEFLARILGDEPTDGHTLVRQYWQRVWKDKSNFEKVWRKRLHEGKALKPVLYPMAGFETHRGAKGLLGKKAAAKAASKDNLEVVFLESHPFTMGVTRTTRFSKSVPTPSQRSAGITRFSSAQRPLQTWGLSHQASSVKR